MPGASVNRFHREEARRVRLDLEEIFDATEDIEERGAPS